MRYHHTKNKGDLGAIKGALYKGLIYLQLDSNWSDRNGVHHVPIDRNAIDVLAIYVPDTVRCYYVDPKALQGKTITLRFDPCRNNNKKRIRWANDFLEIPPTVRGVSAGEASGLVGWGWVRQSPMSRAS